MPLLGLGVYQAREGEEVQRVVRWAIESGYRLIDTAANYNNEEGVGEAVRSSGLERSELFITTKLRWADHGYETALAALNFSLARLGLDYVDLYLIHWPEPEKNEDSWRALEQLQQRGFTRAIGVSNFEPHHLDKLMTHAEVTPSVNQVELHPYLQQQGVRAANDEIGCTTQAWSPLMQGQILNDPAISLIATELGVSSAQVVIRWQLQLGISTIPKSIRRGMISQNADVYGFSLSDDHMSRIGMLDKDHRVGPHPDHRGR